MSIRVRPISANLTHDTETFGIMKPYVKIYFGGQQYRTSPQQFGGRTPSWGETFIFNPAGDSNMRIQVWDSDVGNDDLIGEGSFNLMSVYNTPCMRSDNEYIDLFYKGRSAGRILISFQLQNMGGYWGGQQGTMMGNQMGGNWNNNSGWNNGGLGPQPMGWGGQNNSWGGQQQPPMMNGGYGVQPPMMGGGWNNMPPPNNGWGNQNNNGWGGW